MVPLAPRLSRCFRLAASLPALAGQRPALRSEVSMSAPCRVSPPPPWWALVRLALAIAVTGCDLSGATTAFSSGVALASSTLIGNRPASIGNYLPGGVILGTPTGGNTGAGTLNTANGMFKNNSAYVNP